MSAKRTIANGNERKQKGNEMNKQDEIGLYDSILQIANAAQLLTRTVGELNREVETLKNEVLYLKDRCDDLEEKLSSKS